MRPAWLGPIGVLCCLIFPVFAGAGEAAAAPLVAQVDIVSQRMTVIENGEVIHVWPVSTARRGYHTPRGVYTPQRLYVSYFSRKYYNSPMPHAIFFRGGFAIHGTFERATLGRPASHGCIRLPPSAATELFGLVRQHGPRHTRIVIL